MEPVENEIEKFRSIEGDDDKLFLSDITKITGFPLELIRKELLIEEGNSKDAEISMKELRSAMLGYLDKTFELSN